MFMTQQVLVVEDYADLNSAITNSLPGEYECTAVMTPEAAIEQLREHHYEVILLAPRLPIREDPVMHFLHEHQPAEVGKVILMTYPDDDTSDEACRTLFKPFNREELLRGVGVPEAKPE
jgi:DNA-binding NtrC family response regulator